MDLVEWAEPSWLAERIGRDCQPVSSSPGRRNFRSVERGDLVVPPTRTAHYGPHSFAVAGPTACNSLPASLHYKQLSVTSFRRLLKTYLFRRADVGTPWARSWLLPVRASKHKLLNLDLDRHTVLNCWSHLADQQTSRSAPLSRLTFQPTHHCRLYQVLSLVSDAVGVAVFIVYHSALVCRPSTQNNLLPLNAKANSNSTDGFGCGKIVGFRPSLDSNSNSVTSLEISTVKTEDKTPRRSWTHNTVNWAVY